LKEETRMPWTRSDERFIRRWLILSEIPGGPDGIDKDWLTEHGGEGAIQPAEGMTHRLANGSSTRWRTYTSLWSDAVNTGERSDRDLVSYAFATVSRTESGPALLCIGSDEPIRVWLNGSLLLDRRTPGQFVFDEYRVDANFKAGNNSLLVKLQHKTGWQTLSVRVLEHGSIPPRHEEIVPSLVESSPMEVTIKTDVNTDLADHEKVVVQAVGAGGRLMAEQSAARGQSVRFDASRWPDGAYEMRCSTHKLNGLLYTKHLPWYKGNAIAAAHSLTDAATKADLSEPNGFATKMLAELVTDRLGKDPGSAPGSWRSIHSPLMEFEEMQLEAAGKPARERPYGFVRLAWRDDIDSSAQFCRAYLPGSYDRSRKWPLVVKLHGRQDGDPEYVHSEGVDARHGLADLEYAGHQGVIYLEPHGRGNTGYVGLGDQDVVRAIQLAKERFSVDEDRVYLMGQSLGAWGVWSVATRHPEVFAAIAPVFGGSDYHSQLSEKELAGLRPLDRFLLDKDSSWSMAEALLHMPILVHHGDADQTVNVDFSRYGVRLLQRWGYDVRYVEVPGYGHEDLHISGNIIDWFLQHRRVSNPVHVRLRSAELQNASAYWAKADQADRPDEFMVIDAEVTGPNTVRVDSNNVLAMTLSPGAGLVDPSKPIKVLWNGEPRTERFDNGRLELRAASYVPGAIEKVPEIGGPIGDVLNTPFAIVTGTQSSDPVMTSLCQSKTDALARMWEQWQHQSPRIFRDSEISEQDAAHYSLILIGGPDANLVARRFAGKLPIEIAADHVRIGSRSFPARDARIQLIYPNPLNAKRYVLLVASTSADGMYFWSPLRLREVNFDFTIEDGHLSSGSERISAADMWVAGGWFDHRWQERDDLVFPGNEGLRAESVVLHAPRPDREISTAILDSYAGRYEIAPGVMVSITRTGKQLVANVDQQATFELVPVSDTDFFIVEGPVRLVFTKDASGRIASIEGQQNGQKFSARRME
jgi:pimeloyl-ACP methyl ester carboxylesterase